MMTTLPAQKVVIFWEGSQESLLELHSCRDDFVGMRNGLIIVWMLHRGIWFEAGKTRQMGRVHTKQRTSWLCKFLFLFFSSLGHIPANRKWSTIATEVLWGIWSGVYILVPSHQKVGSFIATWCLSQLSTCTWEMIRFFWCFWWKETFEVLTVRSSLAAQAGLFLRDLAAKAADPYTSSENTNDSSTQTDHWIWGFVSSMRMVQWSLAQ